MRKFINKFKIGKNYINNTEFKIIENAPYDSVIEIIGKEFKIIEIDKDYDEIITNFMTSEGENFWFEHDSDFGSTCILIK